MLKNMNYTTEIKAVLKTVCKAIDAKKGNRLVILDVSKISSFTDFFVICQGLNKKQNQAICDAILEALKTQIQLFPNHIEGYKEGQWILIDCLEFVVHIFSIKKRDFFQLEKLWTDVVIMEPHALSA